MAGSSYDVIVIGAGAAGMAATADLTRGGLRVLLLEAREECGGRVLTRVDPHTGHTVELGAEFIHGKPREIWELLATQPVPVYEGDGDDWCSEQGRIGECAFFEDVERLLEKMRDCCKPDRSFTDSLRDCGSGVSDKVRRRALQYVSGFNAADPARISVQSLVHQSDAEEAIDGMRTFRVRDGYQRLVCSLLREADDKCFELRTSTIVRRIGWRRGQVQIDARSGDTISRFESPRVLITVPLGVLQAEPGSPGAIEFDPPLVSKREPISQLAMGEVIRVTFSFASRFWETLSADSRSLSGLHFLFSDNPAFPTWWTLAPDPAPILTGWAPAASAQELSGLAEPEIADQSLHSLAEVLHIDRARLDQEVRSACVHDWQSDPFARGAYSYICVGGSDAPRRLGEPIEQTLFFAGEATDVTGNTGTVHGAIGSGQRAAREILVTVDG